MGIKAFLKSKIIFISIQLSIIIFIFPVFYINNISSSSLIYVVLLYLLGLIISLIIEYNIKNSFYKTTYDSLSEMDKKHYLSTVIEEPNFYEGKIFYDILFQCTKSMNDEIALHKKFGVDYREYIETWIHEIKTPISSISLICENNKSPEFKKIQREIYKINGYLEQTLFYARSSNLENDYKITKINLETLVKDAIKKRSSDLISNKAKMEVKSLDYNVFGDAKWLDFIIGQIISNSIKYKKDDLTIKIFATYSKDNIKLHIEDNGIGIKPKDLRFVTKKGYTGENNRNFAKSTGIGLYLCNNLCNKMNLSLSIDSIDKEGTTVTITFPTDSRTLLNN